MRRARIVATVLGMAASIVFLWLAVRGADLDAVRDAVARADRLLLIVALLPMAVVYALQGERWRRIARSERLGWSWFAKAVVGGVAVNNVLPGRIGDVLRARWLAVDGRMPGGRAFATVIVDRGFDVVGLVTLLVLGVAVVADAIWLRRLVIGGLVVLALVVVAIGFARLYTRRRDRDRHQRRSRLRRLARDTLEGLAEPLSPLRAVGFAGVSVATWSVWAAGLWLVADAVRIDLSFVDAAFLTAVLNLGVGIPSSPGFVGTYQWLAVSGLELLGDSAREPALAFAILMQAVWYVPTTAIGGALLVSRGLRVSRQRSAVRRRSKEAVVARQRWP